MDVTPYKFETHEGWPPDGERGDFFGFDADWRPSVLRWHDGAWCGVRLQDYDMGLLPQAFRRSEGTESFVVKWASAPMRYEALNTQQGRG